MALNMCRRQLGRSLTRNYSSHADPETIAKSEKMWQNISLFVGLPAICIVAIRTYIEEKKHMEHYERPPFIKYEYMRMIKKPFPWGDGKTPFFYDKRFTPKPDGWED